MPRQGGTTWFCPTCTLSKNRRVSCNSAPYQFNPIGKSKCQGTDHITGKHHRRAVIAMGDTPLRIDGLKKFFKMIEREDMCVADEEPVDLIKNYIFECGGDPLLSVEAFVPIPVPDQGSVTRPSASSIKRFIATAPWATQTRGKTTFKSKILCCYDDPVCKATCIRNNCPFFHPSRVVHWDQSFTHDPYARLALMQENLEAVFVTLLD